MKEKEKKRVHFHIPAYLHKQLKIMAVEKQTTITDLFLHAMLRYLSQEKSNDKNMSSL
jgi:NRPS condensation-like uncharacterized protein